MKCPECEKNGDKSMVNILGHVCTAAGTLQFFDENGAYHLHDPNITTTQYSCSNGHYFKKNKQSVCWCGYGLESKETQTTI